MNLKVGRHNTRAAVHEILFYPLCTAAHVLWQPTFKFIQWEQGYSLFMATDLCPVRATRKKKQKKNLQIHSWRSTQAAVHEG